MKLSDRRPGNLFRSEGFWLCLLWLLALSARIAYSCWDQLASSLINADAINYFRAGIEFARSGRITHAGFPTAQVMPGMPVLVGLAAMLVPEESLRLLCRILWILMGSLTPLFYYKSVRLFAPRWCAFLTGLVCLMPNLVEIDCFLTNEAPYYLFFSMALYYTLKLGKRPERGDSLRYALSVLGALLFRANILSFLPFTLLYLLLCRKSGREILGLIAVTAAVLALFLVPWSVRNYKVFHEFIPVSYGSGGPLLEGSYQGPYAIDDEAITDAFGPFPGAQAVRERHPALFREDGELKEPGLDQYYRLLLDEEQAKWRLGGWLQLDPMGLLKNTLFKLRYSLNYVWYYAEPLGITWGMLHRLRQLNFLFCGLSLALAFALKKHRKLLSFLALAYTVNFVLVSATYAGDRYAQMLMAYRYVAGGLGLDLLWEARCRLRGRRAGKEQL